MAIRRNIEQSVTGSNPSLSTPEDTAELFANDIGAPVMSTIDIEDYVSRIHTELLRPLSLNLAQQQGALPLWIEDGVLEVAISDPFAFAIVDDFRLYYQQEIRPIIIPDTQLKELINKAFDRATQSALDVMTEWLKRPN